jgi:hypothetical protein
MQGQSAPTVEQVDIALLGVDQIAAAEFVDQLEEALQLARRDERRRAASSGSASRMSGDG